MKDTFEGHKYLQATLKRMGDLTLGLSFPFQIADAQIAYGSMPFQKLNFGPNTGTVSFPTPFHGPALGKTRIIVRFDGEINPKYIEYVPFSIVSALVTPEYFNKLLQLPEQTIEWPDHSFKLVMLQLASRSRSFELVSNEENPGLLKVALSIQELVLYLHFQTCQCSKLRQFTNLFWIMLKRTYFC